MDHRYDDNNIEGPVLTAEPGLIDIEELENHNRAWDNVVKDVFLDPVLWLATYLMHTREKPPSGSLSILRRAQELP